MSSKIREAALRFDLGCALWRLGVTKNTSELLDLLPEQLLMMAKYFEAGSPEHVEIMARYAGLTAAQP